MIPMGTKVGKGYQWKLDGCLVQIASMLAPAYSSRHGLHIQPVRRTFQGSVGVRVHMVSRSFND